MLSPPSDPNGLLNPKSESVTFSAYYSRFIPINFSGIVKKIFSICFMDIPNESIQEKLTLVSFFLLFFICVLLIIYASHLTGKYKV